MSTSRILTHLSSDGDRWDLLAWKYYGDPMLLGVIVMANPGLPIEPVLPAGWTVMIPLLQQTATVAADLPPWTRANF